jgi:hypothetical protein
VGKTRLAYEALQAAALSRMTTLVGAAYEQEGCLPYQPFIEAFDRYLAERRRPPEQHPITHYQALGSTDLQQEHSAQYGSRTWVALACQARGELAAARGDVEAALAYYAEAQAGFQAAGNEYETAQCLETMTRLQQQQSVPGLVNAQA